MESGIPPWEFSDISDRQWWAEQMMQVLEYRAERAAEHGR